MRYVYLIRNLIDDKVYVGQTKNPDGRKKDHWAGSRYSTKGHLPAAMRKHGVENFSFEIIEECSEESIDDQERYWISYYCSRDCDKGYNLESGGHGGKTLSEETKKKISEALKTVQFTAERCKNIGDSLRGIPRPGSRKENNPDKGRKISEALKGRHLSEEHKRATSEGVKRYMATRGEWHPSDEARAKMSEAQKIACAPAQNPYRTITPRRPTKIMSGVSRLF